MTSSPSPSAGDRKEELSDGREARIAEIRPQNIGWDGAGDFMWAVVEAVPNPETEYQRKNNYRRAIARFRTRDEAEAYCDLVAELDRLRSATVPEGFVVVARADVEEVATWCEKDYGKPGEVLARLRASLTAESEKPK